MEKKLRDLKKYDSVWIIDGIELKWAEVKIISKRYDILVYTSYRYFPFRSPYPGAKRAGNMFLEYGEAHKYLQKRIKKKMIVLEMKIDKLVSEFDLLDSICQPPTVKPSTKSPSMKELKPGDSVWYVDKYENEVKGVKVEKIIEEKDECLCCKVLYIYISSFITFKTYPNSSRSLNALYYTDEEQAWRYMLKWKKSRMRTVGKEMERLMKELEKYEEIWRPEERR